MDNASWHKSDKVLNAAKQLGIELFWNSAYRPDLNCVEHCDNALTAHFRKYRLRMITDETPINTKKLVRFYVK